jgi:hypothetical protein
MPRNVASTFFPAALVQVRKFALPSGARMAGWEGGEGASAAPRETDKASSRRPERHVFMGTMRKLRLKRCPQREVAAFFIPPTNKTLELLTLWQE